LHIFNESSLAGFKIAVVIPSYKVSEHIVNVIRSIGPEVTYIYVVDDDCPDNSSYFARLANDKRVEILRHTINQGVGGAVITGYVAAISAGADIIVKIDGDGQMDPSLILDFINPIIKGQADYTKGNRFFNIEKISGMPKIRIFGNAILSFMTKFSSGYWDLFDPTNGYTAIHSNIARRLPLDKISRRYFFETDMLFRLNTLRAVVVDVPMDCKYGDERSSLKVRKIIGEFVIKHFLNFSKRIFYNYYLRDMSIASFELPFGLLLFIFGISFGMYHWVASIHRLTTTPAGTVMLSAMPIIIGLQLILAFLAYDISSVPRRPLHLN